VNARLTALPQSLSIGQASQKNNLSFGEKAYSAAKISAVLDALVAEGVPPVGAFGDADVSLDDLRLP
jgi:hypothetical protein